MTLAPEEDAEPSRSPARLADRRVAWSGAGLLALLLLAIVVERALYGTSDVDTFHAAGRYLWEREALQPETDIRRYPPPFHGLMALFGWMPLWAVALSRTLLGMALLADLPRRLHQLSDVPPREQWPGWLVASPFLVGNLLLGQQGAVLLWVTTSGLAAARSARPALGGGLLAVAGWMKVLPGAVIAIPLALRRERGATLAGAAAATLLLFGLLVGLMGVGETVRSTATWWHLSTEEYSPQSMVEEGNALRYNNQSVPITLARTFGAVYSVEDGESGRIEGQVHVAALPLPVIWGAHRAILVALAAVILALLWRLRGRGREPDAWLGLFSLIVTATMAASPLVWTYYFFWLLPGALYLGRRSRRLALGLFAAVVAGLLSIHLRGLGVHILLAHAVFALVAYDLWRRSAKPAPEPAPGRAAPSGSPGASESRA